MFFIRFIIIISLSLIRQNLWLQNADTRRTARSYIIIAIDRQWPVVTLRIFCSQRLKIMGDVAHTVLGKFIHSWIVSFDRIITQQENELCLNNTGSFTCSVCSLIHYSLISSPMASMTSKKKSFADALIYNRIYVPSIITLCR